MESLPNELIALIGSFLEPKDYVKFAQTSKRFYNIWDSACPKAILEYEGDWDDRKGWDTEYILYGRIYHGQICGLVRDLAIYIRDWEEPTPEELPRWGWDWEWVRVEFAGPEEYYDWEPWYKSPNRRDKGMIKLSEQRQCLEILPLLTGNELNKFSEYDD